MIVRMQVVITHKKTTSEIFDVSFFGQHSFGQWYPGEVFRSCDNVKLVGSEISVL